jgi:hypothetical protein
VRCFSPFFGPEIGLMRALLLYVLAPSIRNYQAE